jgi:hypothetical protein
MRSATLRVIDLGRCGAREYFAASDVPALSSDETPILVKGTIAEENLCLGFNRRWATSLARLPPGFTSARFTTAGGLMYCRNVTILRMWGPERIAEPFDLQSLLTNAAVDELIAQAGRELPIDYDTKYACLVGQKFAGGSQNLIKGRSSGLLMINVGPTAFSEVRSLFKAKRVEEVRDLSEFQLTDAYDRGVVDRIARAGACEAVPSSFDREESEHLERLRCAHSDPHWIEDEARMDLFDCRSFYDDEDIYG